MNAEQIAFVNRAVNVIRQKTYYEKKFKELEKLKDVDPNGYLLAKQAADYALRKLEQYPFLTDESYVPPPNLKKPGSTYIPYKKRERKFLKQKRNDLGYR